jgi:organic hydroperoxide reductase OsmC/OhrA
VPPRLKKSEFAIAVDRDGRLAAERGASVHFGHEWTAEHLLLAALARCSLAALSYHARRDGLWVQASAKAHGVVARREDGGWGFTEIDCAVDARFDPVPNDPGDLLARAERGCFVGASLDPRPRYDWRVNGEPAVAIAIAPAEPS